MALPKWASPPSLLCAQASFSTTHPQAHRHGICWGPGSPPEHAQPPRETEVDMMLCLVTEAGPSLIL